MGYFANGSEGDDYEARWCRRCIHQAHDDEVCAVLYAHLAYNYEQCANEKLRDVLSILIPRDPQGTNARCKLFVGGDNAHTSQHDDAT